MNYYPHHIGDFDRTTRHLTRIERSVYRDLMDLYYDTEARLTLDMPKLCRRILAKSKVERAALVEVLAEFFLKTETGWYHVDIEDEIDAYKTNSSQRAVAGKASAEARRLKKEQALAAGNPAGADPLAASVPTEVEAALKSVATDIQREGNGKATNQNQNQNQNQNTQRAAGDQPPEEPDGSVCVSMADAICMGMKAAGVADAVSSSLDLSVLTEKGVEIGVFVAAAKQAAKKGKGFAYALGIVRTQMEQAAVVATTALAVPAVSVERQNKTDVSRVTVPCSPDADAELRRLAAHAAIPRSGPPPELRERLAQRQGRSNVGAGA